MHRNIFELHFYSVSMSWEDLSPWLFPTKGGIFFESTNPETKEKNINLLRSFDGQTILDAHDDIHVSPDQPCNVHVVRFFLLNLFYYYFVSNNWSC